MEERNKEYRAEAANIIIRNHMVWSMGAGFIPVPIADFFAVSAIQLDMIRQLCKLYDEDFKEKQGKAIVSALTGSGLARLGARAVKFIPGVGSVLGGITLAILSGASTYALGEVFKKHFETGGTFLDFDVERLKKYYDEMFEKGKAKAEEVRQEQKKQKDVAEQAPTMNADVITRLKELGELKANGIISEEEFLKLKKQIIG